MSGPWASDRSLRRAWWDQRLWLQLVLVGVIVLVALVVVYGVSMATLPITGAIVVIIYALTKVLMR